MRRLILFDIDGTLVWGGPAKESFCDALMETYGTAGDPESIFFCARVGLDYVSCSPYRVPVARLAAAQAALGAQVASQA